MTQGYILLLDRNEILEKDGIKYHIHILSPFFMLLVHLESGKEEWVRTNTISKYKRVKNLKRRYCMSCKKLHDNHKFYRDADICKDHVNTFQSYKKYMENFVFHYDREDEE